MAADVRHGAEAGQCYRARGLARTYGSGESAVQAMRGVDLDICRGEMIVLLGPSGSGKSTLRPGARVVLHPSDRVRDGIRVRVRT